MSVEFYNIRSGERRVVTSEPMIAAFYNSGDRHANATVGQDMGWRLAPSTVKRINDIKRNRNLLAEIASTFQLPLDGVSDTDILHYISLEESRKEAEEQETQEFDFEREYQAEIQAITAKPKAESKAKAGKSADSKAETDNVKIDDASTNNEGNE